MTKPNQYPIVPPPELVGEWAQNADLMTKRAATGISALMNEIAAKAAQWGADREYEETCAWIEETCIPETLVEYKEARRPKVPTLQEKALDILGKHGDLSPKEHDAIRIALENLPRKL